MDGNGRYMINVFFGRTPLHQGTPLIKNPEKATTDYVEVGDGHQAVVMTSEERDWQARPLPPGSNLISAVARKGATKPEMMWIQHELSRRYPDYAVSVHSHGGVIPCASSMCTGTICLFQERRPHAPAPHGGIGGSQAVGAEHGFHLLLPGRADVPGQSNGGD